MTDCACSIEEKLLEIDVALCGLPCQGCSFSNDITCTVTGDDKCVFTGTVSRTGCSNNPDDAWSVDTTMSCGSADHKLTYYCDDLRMCARYEVTLKCLAESPPGG